MYAFLFFRDGRERHDRKHEFASRKHQLYYHLSYFTSAQKNYIFIFLSTQVSSSQFFFYNFNYISMVRFVFFNCLSASGELSICIAMSKLHISECTYTIFSKKKKKIQTLTKSVIISKFSQNKKNFYNFNYIYMVRFVFLNFLICIAKIVDIATSKLHISARTRFYFISRLMRNRRDIKHEFASRKVGPVSLWPGVRKPRA